MEIVAVIPIKTTTMTSLQDGVIDVATNIPPNIVRISTITDIVRTQKRTTRKKATAENNMGGNIHKWRHGYDGGTINNTTLKYYYSATNYITTLELDHTTSSHNRFIVDTGSISN